MQVRESLPVKKPLDDYRKYPKRPKRRVVTKNMTIPDLDKLNPDLDKLMDDMTSSFTEYKHTAQMIAHLCMTANGDKNIDVNDPKTLELFKQAEHSLYHAAMLYKEVCLREKEGPEETHRIGV